ncbi:MAG: acyl-ACP desaturase [Chloroflexi bacterium]|nr:acyl-ACP desaturase [Chloroflexota bacterium]
MPVATQFRLPKTAAPKLEALVDEIVARPGAMIDVKEIRAAGDKLDVHDVVDHLPDGVDEEDFVGILKLAMLTESATDSYAAVFELGAKEFDAPWLGRFNQDIWVPDEHTHYTPYMPMLLSLGFSEDELEREIREIREKRYDHCCGRSPIELTTYGVIQEYLTDNWHGLIAQMLKERAPYAAHCANLVKRRETLHTVWYRDMTAVMVEENPDMLGLVADTMLSFEMPGTSLVPHLGDRALEWMTKLDVNFKQIARDFVRTFSEAAGTMRRNGELLVNIAVRRGYSMGPFPPQMVQRALNLLGGPGYGLLGEAVLERVGLPRPPLSQEGQNPGMRLYTGIYDKIRSKARTFISSRIDLRSITGETAG